MISPEAVLALTKQLAVLPAPSKDEGERVTFCLRFWQEHGVNAFCDGANNVIVEIGDVQKDPIVLLTAHTDIVFSREIPLVLREEGDRLYCPGIGDDTVHVAFLLLAAVHCTKQTCPHGVSFVFAANSGEEGEGNLCGCRALMARYGDRLREMIAFDSFLPTVNTDAVGSRRYRLTVQTRGGHSFRDFGEPNAIALLAKLITELDSQPVPTGGKTTYNFGGITGGTTVNSIAASASLLYEFRSDRNENAEQMERQFRAAVERLQRQCDLTVETVGVRPCAKGVDPVRQRELTERVLSCFSGLPAPSQSPASTDCNLPLAAGIPAVCVGLIRGQGAHTTAEYIEKSSVSDGVSVLKQLLSVYGF